MRWKVTGVAGVVAAFVMAALVGVVGAQSGAVRPDFSGKWALDLQRSRLAQPFQDVTRGVVRIEHQRNARDAAFPQMRDDLFGQPVYAISRNDVAQPGRPDRAGVDHAFGDDHFIGVPGSSRIEHAATRAWQVQMLCAWQIE